MVSLSEIVNRVAPDVMGCPSLIITSKVKDVLVDFCKESWILHQSIVASVLSTDVTEINDGVDIDISTIALDRRPINIFSLSVDGTPFVTEKMEISSAVNDISNLVDSDILKFNFPDDDTVRIFPLDEVDQEIIVDVVFTPTLSITEIDDNIFYDHHETIESGVKAKLFGMPGKDWSDGNLAMTHMAIYGKGVNDAKVSATQHYDFKRRMNTRQYRI